MSLNLGGGAGLRFLPAKNTTGAAVNVGSVLMLDFDTERDGYSAIVPVLTNQKDYLAPCGPVVGTPGGSFLDDQELMIGIQGIFPTLVESTQDIAIEDALYLSAGNAYLVTLAAQPSFGATPATIAAAAFNKTVAAVAKTATAVAKTATAVTATATPGTTKTAATFTIPTAFPTATMAANFNATMYVVAEINALGDAVLGAKGFADAVITDLAALDTYTAKVAVDVAALDTFTDQAVVDLTALDAFSDAVVVDLTALDAFTDQVFVDVPIIETLLDELKTDFDTNATILGDSLEPRKIKAIALAARTANDSGLINCYWLGR